MDLARLERLIHAIDSGRFRREVLTGLLGGVLVSLGFPHRSLLTLTVDATETNTFALPLDVDIPAE
jgi:hypothetical protein